MRKARELSPDGIIGYNIMVALKDYKEHVKAAVKAGADLIISGAGIPSKLPELISGSDVKIAPIVSTLRSACASLLVLTSSKPAGRAKNSNYTHYLNKSGIYK